MDLGSFIARRFVINFFDSVTDAVASATSEIETAGGDCKEQVTSEAQGQIASTSPL